MFPSSPESAIDLTQRRLLDCFSSENVFVSPLTRQTLNPVSRIVTLVGSRSGSRVRIGVSNFYCVCIVDLRLPTASSLAVESRKIRRYGVNLLDRTQRACFRKMTVKMPRGVRPNLPSWGVA